MVPGLTGLFFFFLCSRWFFGCKLQEKIQGEGRWDFSRKVDGGGGLDVGGMCVVGYRHGYGYMGRI